MVTAKAQQRAEERSKYVVWATVIAQGMPFDSMQKKELNSSVGNGRKRGG